MSKKIISIVLGIAFIGFSAFAALDAYDSMTVKELGKPMVVTGVVFTNAAVDISAAKGIANLLVYQTSAYTNAVNYTNIVTLQKATAAGGTYSTVTSVLSTVQSGTGVVTSLKVDVQRLSRYVRLLVETKNDTGTGGAVLIYPK